VHRLNNQLGGLTPKSSWYEYIEDKNKGMCEKKIILEQFNTVHEYKKFALESILEKKEEKKEIHELLLE
jgi:hypothetical protein